MSRELHPWRIRDVGDGNTGWVQGRLVGEPPLVARFSRRPCFYYSALHEGVASYKDAVEELLIEDDTGHAIVELAGATIQVAYDHESWPPGASDPITGQLTGPPRREGILGPGEIIAVHGLCRWERDPSPVRYGLYRDPLPRRLRISGTSRVKIWVTEKLG